MNYRVRREKSIQPTACAIEQLLVFNNSPILSVAPEKTHRNQHPPEIAPFSTPLRSEFPSSSVGGRGICGYFLELHIVNN